jgi:hypothetical protein
MSMRSSTPSSTQTKSDHRPSVMRRPGSRRRPGVTVSLVLVAGLVVISAGAWGLRSWQPFAHSSDAPSSWPRNIEPLARYAEVLAGETFVHPLHIVFHQGDDYDDAVRADQMSLTASSVAAQTTDDDAFGRALGLWSGEPSKDVLGVPAPPPVILPATWQPDRDTIVVRAVSSMVRLDPELRVVLVAQLTQVLQDQRYGIREAINDASTPQRRAALISLSTGQAEWISDRYVDDLSADDFDSYSSAAADTNARFDRQNAANPLARIIIRRAQHEAGAAFVAALHESDPSRIAQAFTADPPDAMDQMMEPAARYLRRDAVESDTEPPIPRRATLLFHRQLGPVALMLVLSLGSPPNTALQAADGWGNDALTVYRIDGRVCIDGSIVADSADDAARLDGALHQWAATRPAASAVLVGRAGTSLLFSVCDPGIGATQPALDPSAGDQIVERSQQIRAAITDDTSSRQAECLWIPLYEQYTARQLDDDYDAVADAHDTASAACGITD